MRTSTSVPSSRRSGTVVLRRPRASRQAASHSRRRGPSGERSQTEVPVRSGTTKSRAAAFDAITRPRSSVSAIGSGSDRAKAMKASGVMSPAGGAVERCGGHARPPSPATASGEPGAAAGAAGGGT